MNDLPKSLTDCLDAKSGDLPGTALTREDELVLKALKKVPPGSAVAHYARIGLEKRLERRLLGK